MAAWRTGDPAVTVVAFSAAAVLLGVERMAGRRWYTT